jgi:single-strand DNA-binding protein
MMSRQYNKLTIVGHLGADPEMRYAPSGKAVTSFSIATNDQYSNGQGQAVKITTWFRCSAWGKLAEVCNQYLRKSSKVLVEGRLSPDAATGRPRLWTRQDGSPAADYEVTVREIYFLDPKGESKEDEAPTPVPAEEDMPF